MGATLAKMKLLTILGKVNQKLLFTFVLGYIKNVFFVLLTTRKKCLLLTSESTLRGIVVF